MKYISLKILLVGSLLITLVVPAYFTIQNALSQQPMETGNLLSGIIFTVSFPKVRYLSVD